MATLIENSANITFTYAGQTGTAVSNTAATNLLEEYSFTAAKFSQNSDWRPSENLTYYVTVTNAGRQPIFAVSLQDDLGDNINPLLTYLSGSVRMIRGDTITAIVPTHDAPLTIVMPDPLAAGESVTFSYIAKVQADLAASVTEITNEVTVAGHKASAAGDVITVDPSPSLTLPKANYADVRISKTADKSVASVGDTLTYVFKLENYGNVEATGIMLRDDLPAKFLLNAITAETGGTITSFASTDYSLDASNKLILPTSTVKTISVPAAGSSGAGVTIITITGTITA